MQSIGKTQRPVALRPVLLAMVLAAAIPAGGCAKSGTDPVVAVSQGPGGSSQRGQAGCATCIFDMPGVTGCVLAVKIDGQAYLVEGSDIDDHGDAHGSAGLCNAARPAVFEGKIVDGKLLATSFALQPQQND